MLEIPRKQPEIALDLKKEHLQEYSPLLYLLSSKKGLGHVSRAIATNRFGKY